MSFLILSLWSHSNDPSSLFVLSAHVPPSVDGRFCFVYVKQTASSSPHIRHVLHIRVVINKQLQTAGSLLHWRKMHSQIQRQGVVEEMIEARIAEGLEPRS